MNENKTTILPDGSAFSTATIMSREEAMKLPLKERPICFRISSEMYHDTFQSIAGAARCFNPLPDGETFLSEQCAAVAVDLCFKIANEVERNQVGMPGAWICDRCGFVLQKNIINGRSGTITANNEPFNEPCPNDGKLMRPLTWREANEGYDKALMELRRQYDELLMAVARKFPNETRHQTALRYIQEAEKRADSTSTSEVMDGHQ